MHMMSVAKAVLLAFAGPPTTAGLEALHRDGDAFNDDFDNLYWGTQSENIQDAISHGRWAAQSQCGEAHPGGTLKLSDDDVRTIRYLHAEGTSQRTLAEKYKVHQSQISRIISRKRRRHE